MYVQTDIAGYNPAPGDLAYPQKLEMMKRIEEEAVKRKESEAGAEPKEDEAKDQKDQQPTVASAVDLHCLWYPTVRRTVMCLVKLFKCLDVSFF